MPPSRPNVDGHECPRHFTVNPFTIASLSEAEQIDCRSVVLASGLEIMALIPSLTKGNISDEKLEGRRMVETDGGLSEQLGGPQPFRIAQASRYCVMLGVASIHKPIVKNGASAWD
jgi:hypothetical protein